MTRTTSTETPSKIMLYGGIAGFGLPDVSPYVMKTEVQLRMAGLPFAKLPGDLQQAPKHKIPYIDDDGLLGDSTFIRAHVERKYGVDLDRGLSPRQRAEAWAIERMLEDHLAWAITHERWLRPENFAKGPAHFFDGAPEAIRETLRADVLDRVRANFHGHGIGRHSREEIAALGARSLAALSVMLGDKEYLFGDTPTGTDATAFAVLACALTPFFDTAIRLEAERYENLVAYTGRMMAKFYPGFAWERAC
jgi:glutathione S-transferase